MNFLIALLDAAPAAAPESPSIMPTILMFVALGAIMYFFMIRPPAEETKRKSANFAILSKSVKLLLRSVDCTAR